MWTMFVVPIGERKKLSTALFFAVRNQYSASALVLQAFDQTLDHGDAAMLADSTVSRRLDAFAFDPTSKSVAVEDAVPVADDVLWNGAGAPRRAPQESAYIPATRSIGEDADTHRTARSMIHDNRNPMAEGPPLR